MKQDYFYHDGQKYGAGTEFWFTGMCHLKGENIYLKDKMCTFKYISLTTGHAVFDVDGEETWCDSRTFDKSISLEHERVTTQPQEEFYLSKESFNKLLIYIIVMVVCVIFYD